MGQKKENKNRETIYFSDEAYAALMRWKKKYPNCILSDFANGAVRFMDRQAVLGLDASCQPVDPTEYTEVITRIISASRDGPTKTASRKQSV